MTTTPSLTRVMAFSQLDWDRRRTTYAVSAATDVATAAAASGVSRCCIASLMSHVWAGNGQS